MISVFPNMCNKSH